MIAIVAAMAEELAPLRARAGAARIMSRPDEHPFTLSTARLGRAAVALAVTGDGERRARLGAERLESVIALRRLIVVGIAGAASAGLAPGSLVVADQVRREAGERWDADPACVAAAVRAGARPVSLVSAQRIADTPEAKRRLAGDAGRAVAVDLESASYVAAAAQRGIPWTVLRVISDGADESLPPLLNRARDAGGSVRRGAVALGLLRDWAALPALLRMRERLQRAAVVLADAVERILSEA